MDKTYLIGVSIYTVNPHHARGRSGSALRTIPRMQLTEHSKGLNVCQRITETGWTDGMGLVHADIKGGTKEPIRDRPAHATQPSLSRKQVFKNEIRNHLFSNAVTSAKK